MARQTGVAFRVDVGAAHAGPVVHGAPAVAQQVLATAPKLPSVAGFTVVNTRIVTIDIIADPDKLRRPSIAP